MDENKKEDISIFENIEIIGRVNTNKLDEYIKSDIKTLDQILSDITKDEKIYKEIKLGSRKRYLSSYKKEYVEATKTIEEIIIDVQINLSDLIEYISIMELEGKISAVAGGRYRALY